MDKVDKVTIINSKTLEVLSTEYYESLKRDDFKAIIARIECYIKDPNKLYTSVYKNFRKELKIYIKYKNLSKDLKSFNSYYRVNKEYLYDCVKNGLSVPILSTLDLLLNFVNTSYTIVYDNNVPIKTDETIAKVLNMPEITWKTHKRELIKHKIIKKINFDKQICYKISPCAYGFMREVGLGTYYAFRDEIKAQKMLDLAICLDYDSTLLFEFGIGAS